MYLQELNPFIGPEAESFKQFVEGPGLSTCRAVAVRWPTSGLCYNGLPSF